MTPLNCGAKTDRIEIWASWLKILNCSARKRHNTKDGKNTARCCCMVLFCVTSISCAAVQDVECKAMYKQKKKRKEILYSLLAQCLLEHTCCTQLTRCVSLEEARLCSQATEIRFYQKFRIVKAFVGRCRYHASLFFCCLTCDTVQYDQPSPIHPFSAPLIIRTLKGEQEQLCLQTWEDCNVPCIQTGTVFWC